MEDAADDIPMRNNGLRKKPGKLGEFKGKDALRAENKLAADAAKAAGLDQDQAEQLHGIISGEGLSSYHDILEVAQDIANGQY